MKMLGTKVTIPVLMIENYGFTNLLPVGTTWQSCLFLYLEHHVVLFKIN